MQMSHGALGRAMRNELEIRDRQAQRETAAIVDEWQTQSCTLHLTVRLCLRYSENSLLFIAERSPYAVTEIDLSLSGANFRFFGSVAMAARHQLSLNLLSLASALWLRVCFCQSIRARRASLDTTSMSQSAMWGWYKRC